MRIAYRDRLLFACAISAVIGCSHGEETFIPPFVEGWAEATELTPVEVERRRDSVIVHVPEVALAQDYRVIIVKEGMTVSANANGQEHVVGTTIFCAGREQHAAPVEEKPNAVLRAIEVSGLTGMTKIVVEAIDRECPFVGLLAGAHQDVPVIKSVQDDWGSDPTFPMRTEAEIVAEHGSMIVNGHGPGAVLARPALPNDPHVLARAELIVSPLGLSNAPTAHFEDFEDANDQFTWVGTYKDRSGGDGGHFRNSTFSFFNYGSETDLWGNRSGGGQTVAFIDRGQLHTYVADWAQDVFGVNMLVPRMPLELDDDDYLHVTFSVAPNMSDRRYPWISFCGAGTQGETFDAQGNLKGRMHMTPFFYQNDGLSPYVEGWSCLQVFPFEGGYYTLDPFDEKPESSIRVIMNRAHEGDTNNRDNVVNVSPNQYGASANSPSCPWCGWYRTWNASKTPSGLMLDDVLRMAPRVRFDLYIRRNRVVMYVDGEEKLCSDFPLTPLTMAEGALGFGHVLYHSSAEQPGFTRNDWVRSGQRYYRTNTPWIDARTWDDLGWEEHEGLPNGFDPARCYVSDRQ